MIQFIKLNGLKWALKKIIELEKLVLFIYYMKFLIILLLIVLIISLVVLYPKENFFSRGPKLVEKTQQ